MDTRSCPVGKEVKLWAEREFLRPLSSEMEAGAGAIMGPHDTSKGSRGQIPAGKGREEGPAEDRAVEEAGGGGGQYSVTAAEGHISRRWEAQKDRPLLRVTGG